MAALRSGDARISLVGKNPYFPKLWWSDGMDWWFQGRRCGGGSDGRSDCRCGGSVWKSPSDLIWAQEAQLLKLSVCSAWIHGKCWFMNQLSSLTCGIFPPERPIRRQTVYLFHQQMNLNLRRFCLLLFEAETSSWYDTRFFSPFHNFLFLKVWCVSLSALWRVWQ